MRGGGVGLKSYWVSPSDSVSSGQNSPMISALIVAAAIGHTDSATCVAYRPDGVVFASGGWDNVIRIWRADDGKHLRLLKGHRSHVTDIDFSPDGKRLVSSSGDGTVRIWSPGDGRLLRTIQARTSYVAAVEWADTGAFIASAGYDNRVHLWNPTTGKLIRTLTGLKSDAYAMGVSPDGKHVAAGGPSGGLVVWSSADGKRRQEFPGWVNAIGDVAFRPDSRVVAYLSLGGDFRAVSLADEGIEFEAKLEGNRADGLAWHPHENQLAIAGDRVSIYELGTGELLRTLEGMRQGANAVAWSPDGGRVIAASNDRALYLWSNESAELIRRHGEAVAGP